MVCAFKMLKQHTSAFEFFGSESRTLSTMALALLYRALSSKCTRNMPVNEYFPGSPPSYS